MNRATTWFAGRLVEPVRRVDLLQLALEHDGDTVPHRHGLDLIVGDVDHRGSEPALERRDLGACLDAELCVEVAERFVHEENLRLANDRPTDRDALSLSARQRARLPVEIILKVENLRRLEHALVRQVLSAYFQLEPEAHILRDGHVRVKRIILEHHRYVAFLRRNIVTSRSPWRQHRRRRPRARRPSGGS